MPDYKRGLRLAEMMDERIRNLPDRGVYVRLDPAGRLQYHAARDLLIVADDAMEAEGIPLEQRDRIITRTIWGGDPAFVAARDFELATKQLLTAQPMPPEQLAVLKAEIEALGGTITHYATADDRPDAAVYNTVLAQIRAERATQET